MKKFFALILLGYLILSFYWPEIFINNWIFLLMLIIAFFIFFFELNFKEKKYLFLGLILVALLFVKPLPQLYTWILQHHVSILVAIGLGVLMPVLLILVIFIVFIYIINKFIKKILG